MKKKKQLNKRANTLTVNVTSDIHVGTRQTNGHGARTPPLSLTISLSFSVQQSLFKTPAKFAKKGITPVHVPFPSTITVTDFPVAPSVVGRRRQLKLKTEEAAAAAAAAKNEDVDDDGAVDRKSALEESGSTDEEDDDDGDGEGDDESDGKAKPSVKPTVKPKSAVVLAQVSSSYVKKSRKQRVETVTNVSKAVLILLCQQRGVPAAVYEPMNFKQIMTHVRSFEPMVHIQELIAVQAAANALQLERKAKFASIKAELKAAGRDRATIKQKKREEAAARRLAAREEQEEIVRRRREADEAEAKRRGVPYVPPLPRKKRQKLDVYGIDREAERRRRAEETSSDDDDSDDSELQIDSESSEDEDERNAKRNLIWSRKKSLREHDRDHDHHDVAATTADTDNRRTTKRPRTDTASISSE